MRWKIYTYILYIINVFVIILLPWRKLTFNLYQINLKTAKNTYKQKQKKTIYFMTYSIIDRIYDLKQNKTLFHANLINIKTTLIRLISMSFLLSSNSSVQEVRKNMAKKLIKSLI